MKMRGSCHCGNIRFEAEGELAQVLSCNCSICSRKGSLLTFVPRERFNLESSQGLQRYTFNKHVIKHAFCGKCGIHTHGEGIDPKGNAVVAINVRCVEGVDPESPEVKRYDGRAL